MKKILSFLFIAFTYSCTVEDSIEIDNYEFYSLYEWGKEIEKPKNVDVVANIRGSKRIKGPVKGYYSKTLLLVNKEEREDTLKIIIYGKDNMYFRIGNKFFQAEKPILQRNQRAIKAL